MKRKICLVLFCLLLAFCLPKAAFAGGDPATWSDWGYFYDCEETYDGDYVYVCHNGTFAYAYGMWTDGEDSETEITLPASVPGGMALPRGMVITGWNIRGPVEWDEGPDEDSDADDDMVKGDILCENAEPGTSYIFGTDAEDLYYDVYVEPVWEKGVFSVSGIRDGGDLAVRITANGLANVRLAAVRYEGKEEANVRIQTVSLYKGETSVRIDGFCRDGADYKLLLFRPGSIVPVCKAFSLTAGDGS